MGAVREQGSLPPSQFFFIITGNMQQDSEELCATWDTACFETTDMEVSLLAAGRGGKVLSSPSLLLLRGQASPPDTLQQGTRHHKANRPACRKGTGLPCLNKELCGSLPEPYVRHIYI